MYTADLRVYIDKTVSFALNFFFNFRQANSQNRRTKTHCTTQIDDHMFDFKFNADKWAILIL